MILKIRSTGEPVLRERARPLRPEEILLPSTQELIASMRETMHDAPGVGLAAPQIGLPLQLAVIEDREEYMKDFTREMLAERERKPVAFEVIINPVLTLESEPEVEFFEGCLSLRAWWPWCLVRARSRSSASMPRESRRSSGPRAGMRVSCSTRSIICRVRCMWTGCVA